MQNKAFFLSLPQIHSLKEFLKDVFQKERKGTRKYNEWRHQWTCELIKTNGSMKIMSDVWIKKKQLTPTKIRYKMRGKFKVLAF